MDLPSTFAGLIDGLSQSRQQARVQSLRAAVAAAERGSRWKRFLIAHQHVLAEGGAAMLLQAVIGDSELRAVCLDWLAKGEKAPPWLREAFPAEDAGSPLLWRMPSQRVAVPRLTGRGSVLAAHGKQVLELGLEEGEIRHRWRLPNPVTRFVLSPDGESLVIATSKTLHRLPWRGKATEDGISIERSAEYPISYLAFDEAGEHVVSGHQMLRVAIHRATDLAVVAEALVPAEFKIAHPFDGDVLAGGIQKYLRKLVVVDVARREIRVAFGDDVSGWVVVDGGRIVSCETASGRRVL